MDGRPQPTMAAERGPRQMANPFVKGWRYLMALFGAKIDEYADPKVQIQQAIEDAQRQHQALVQQAAAVIGNQRQLEMKLSRTMDEVQKLQASARDEEREKIEGRYATARGRAELASNSVEGRMLEVQKSTLDMAGASRLDQIRASMAGEQLAAAPARPAVEAAPTAAPVDTPTQP